MKELIFLVEEDVDGGFNAKCLSESIFTEAETIEELKQNITEAVRCHFDDDIKRVIRMHIVKELVFAA